MHSAIRDVKQKLAGLSPVHYEPLWYIIAYTAAGHTVQLHSVFASNQQVCVCVHVQTSHVSDLHAVRTKPPALCTYSPELPAYFALAQLGYH